MQWFLIVLVFGVSFTLWTVVGGMRLASERLGRTRGGPGDGRRPLSPDDVAVLVPAHNEELVIASTIASVLKAVPPANVHVVADGCDDDTAAIARSYGVNVLELRPAHGKAGGIDTAVREFDLPHRFEALLIVDADTELDERYLDRGLPLLEDEDTVAVAGYAKSTWRPRDLSPVGRFLVAYRIRLYAVMQWLKYGQTWRHTNVTAIVPGFASMYRTRILPQMDLNPPGLVIEDFNMTFEIHRKRLGKIAFRPGVFALTQDPDNFRDYYRQVKRWQLGFWQTVRRHKFWPSWFSAVLALFLFEVMVASLAVVALVLALVLLALPALTGGAILHLGWFASLHNFLESYLTPTNLLLFLVLPDYLLTCLTAIGMRRPGLLLYGTGFLALRLVDATATLWTFPQAWLARSTGRWTSPARRPAGGAPTRPALPAPVPVPTPADCAPAAPAPAPVPVRASTPVLYYAPALACLRSRPPRSHRVLSAARRMLVDWRADWLAVCLLVLSSWVTPFAPRSLASRLLPVTVSVLAAVAFFTTPVRRRSWAVLAGVLAVGAVVVTRAFVAFGP